MRIVFVTDLHGVTEYVPLLVEKERGADLLLLGGDVTNFGGAAEARAALAPLRAAFPRVYAVPGNVDGPEVVRWLEAEGLSLHGRGLAPEGGSGKTVYLSGLGGSNHTPLKAPTEFDEETIGALLQAGAPEAPRSPSSHWIVVSHVPPRDTAADRLFLGTHVGSSALRAFLLDQQPSLCLCGHIHESRGTDRLGPTEVANPGAFTAARYAVVEVTGNGLSCELHKLEVPRLLWLRATARMAKDKVVGYARHRFGGAA